METLHSLLTTLRAIAELTRLRLLNLCAHAELTVSELTQILSQNQPRVSRHLRLLYEAGLLNRHPEGSWVYFRTINDNSEKAQFVRTVIDSLPEHDPDILLDMKRLQDIKKERAQIAQNYFAHNAQQWHLIRSLHVPEKQVEDILLSLLPERGISNLLDIGTGTGRMLEIFAPQVARGVGIDLSHEMLVVARSNLERAGLSHCQVRKGDMYALSIPSESFDAVILHQVLHYAEDPEHVIQEAARVTRPGGYCLIVDFAKHALEDFQTVYAHQKLGFSDEEIRSWCMQYGLEIQQTIHLPGDPLTVSIWPTMKSHF